jgi:hypothetical protein
MPSLPSDQIMKPDGYRIAKATRQLDKLGFGDSARLAGAAISRMPRAVRDLVSRALEDGADWKQVAAICKSHGHDGIRPQNVTNYRKGAHQEWIRREERMEAIRRDSETTAAVVRHYAENGGSPAEAGLLAAAEVMAQALSGLGPEAMQILIADDPKALFGITRELARVAELLGKKGDRIASVTAVAESAPALSEEQQAAKIVAMVDAALGIKGK